MSGGGGGAQRPLPPGYQRESGGGPPDLSTAQAAQPRAHSGVPRRANRADRRVMTAPRVRAGLLGPTSHNRVRLGETGELCCGQVQSARPVTVRIGTGTGREGPGVQGRAAEVLTGQTRGLVMLSTLPGGLRGDKVQQGARFTRASRSRQKERCYLEGVMWDWVSLKQSVVVVVRRAFEYILVIKNELAQDL